MGFIPIAGDAYDLVSAGIGYDVLAGQSLSATERGLYAAAAFLPVSGGSLRVAKGLGDVYGGRTSVEAALRGAEKYLGTGYREIAPGVFRSGDGTRQFRMTNGDLTQGHVHFESIGPNGRTITENSHVYFR